MNLQTKRSKKAPQFTPMNQERKDTHGSPPIEKPLVSLFFIGSPQNGIGPRSSGCKARPGFGRQPDRVTGSRVGGRGVLKWYPESETETAQTAQTGQARMLACLWDWDKRISICLGETDQTAQTSKKRGQRWGRGCQGT